MSKKKKNRRSPDLKSDPVINAVSSKFSEILGVPYLEPIKISRLIMPDEYIEMATDYKYWFEKAAGIEYYAKMIWNHFLNTKNENQKLAEANIEIAHLLFGLALEVALKGELIRLDPGNIKLEKIFSKDGKIEKVTFRGIKNITGDGHDLMQLEEQVGLLNDSNAIDIRSILNDFTLFIRWQARYPVPKSSIEKDPPDYNIKYSYKSKWLIDWILPLLDKLIGKFRFH